MDEISRKNEVDINAEQNTVNFGECLALGDDYRAKKNIEKAARYYELATNVAGDAEIASLSVDERLRVGNTLFDSKKYASVIKWLDRLSNNDAIIRVGDCHFHLSEYDKALEKYLLADSNSLSEDQKIFVADRLFASNPDQALDYYLLCDGIDSDLHVIKSIGDCYMSMDEPSDALEYYEKHHSLKEDPEIGIKIADILFAEDHHREALDYYLKYEKDIESKKVSQCIDKCYGQERAEEFAKNIIELYHSKELYDLEAEWCLKHIKDFGYYEFVQEKAEFFLNEGFKDNAIRLCDEIVELTADRYKKSKDIKSVNETAGWLKAKGLSDHVIRLYDLAIEWTIYFKDPRFIRELADSLWEEKELESCVIKLCNGAVDLAANSYKYSKNYKSVHETASWLKAKGLDDHVIRLYDQVIGWTLKHATNVKLVKDLKEMADWLWEANSGDYAVKDRVAKLYEFYTDKKLSPTTAKILGDYYSDRDYSKAIEWYEKSDCFSSKENEKLILTIIDLYKKLGKESDALGWYMRLGKIKLEKGDKKAVAKLYSDYAEICFNLKMHEFLVDYYYNEQQWDKALGYYKSIEKNSNDTIRVQTVKNVISIYEKKRDENLALGKGPEYKDKLAGLSRKLGDALYSSGQKGAAVTEYLKIADQKLNNEIKKRIGDYYADTGDIKNATLWYNQISNVENDANVNKRLGDLCLNNKDASEAILHYERYYQLKKPSRKLREKQAKEYEELVCELSVLYAKAGRQDDAKRILTEYVKSPYVEVDHQKIANTYNVAGIKITDPKQQITLGDYYFKKGNYQEADRWYERIWNKNDSDLAYKVGSKYYYIGKKDKALIWYLRSWNNGEKILVARSIGDIYWETEKQKEAIIWYERYLSEYSDITLIRRVAEWYSDKGDMKKALSIYTKIPPRATDVDTNKRIGDLSLAAGNENDAIRYYETYIKYQIPNRYWRNNQISEYVNVVVHLMILYTKAGRHNDAKKLLANHLNSKYIKLDHDEIAKAYKAAGVDIVDREYQTIIGDYYFKKGDYQEADRWYERIWNKNGGDLAYNVGNNYYYIGKKDKALIWYLRSWNNGEKILAARSIGDIYWGSEKQSEAIIWYERYLSKCSDEILMRRVKEWHYNNDNMKKASSPYTPPPTRANDVDTNKRTEAVRLNNAAPSKIKPKKLRLKDKLGLIIMLMIGVVVITIMTDHFMQFDLYGDLPSVIRCIMVGAIPFVINSLIARKLCNNAKWAKKLTWGILFAQYAVFSIDLYLFICIPFDIYSLIEFLVYILIPVGLSILACLFISKLMSKSKAR